MAGLLNLALHRNPYTGRPIRQQFVPTNRSELVRRIFRQYGNVSNYEVHAKLLRFGGGGVSDSVISAQRRKLIDAGVLNDE